MIALVSLFSIFTVICQESVIVLKTEEDNIYNILLIKSLDSKEKTIEDSKQYTIEDLEESTIEDSKENRTEDPKDNTIEDSKENTTKDSEENTTEDSEENTTEDFLLIKQNRTNKKLNLGELNGENYISLVKLLQSEIDNLKEKYEILKSFVDNSKMQIKGIFLGSVTLDEKKNFFIKRKTYNYPNVPSVSTSRIMYIKDNKKFKIKWKPYREDLNVNTSSRKNFYGFEIDYFNIENSQFLEYIHQKGNAFYLNLCFFCKIIKQIILFIYYSSRRYFANLLGYKTTNNYLGELGFSLLENDKEFISTIMSQQMPDINKNNIGDSINNPLNFENSDQLFNLPDFELIRQAFVDEYGEQPSSYNMEKVKNFALKYMINNQFNKNTIENYQNEYGKTNEHNEDFGLKKKETHNKDIISDEKEKFEDNISNEEEEYNKDSVSTEETEEIEENVAKPSNNNNSNNVPNNSGNKSFSWLGLFYFVLVLILMIGSFIVFVKLT